MAEKKKNTGIDKNSPPAGNQDINSSVFKSLQLQNHGEDELREHRDHLDLIVKEHHILIALKYGKCARKIKGVIPALNKIKKKFKIGLLTNCSHKEINGLLKGAKINKKIFNIIIGKDDVKKSKPYPNELFKAEKVMHANIKYHVGDSPYDIIAAKRAGVKAIAVLTGVNSRKVLNREKPYKIINSIADLPKVIL